MDYELAVCAQVDPELFFFDVAGGSPQKIKQAKEICVTCPIINECREEAITKKVGLFDGGSAFVVGIWGGTTEAERKEIRKKRRLV
jgi:hypothetical protein